MTPQNSTVTDHFRPIASTNNHQQPPTFPYLPPSASWQSGESGSFTRRLLIFRLAGDRDHRKKSIFRDRLHVRHLRGVCLWGTWTIYPAELYGFVGESSLHTPMFPRIPHTPHVSCSELDRQHNRAIMRSLLCYKGRSPAFVLSSQCYWVFLLSIVLFLAHHHSQWRAENSHSTFSSSTGEMTRRKS